MNQMLTAAVERLRVDERAALLEESEQSGKYCGHPGIEACGRIGAFLERHQLLLQDLGVGMIEARINKIGTIFADRTYFSEHDTECALGRLVARKDERGAAIDWRTV